MVLFIYGITIEINILNSEAPSIWPASIISAGIALMPAENTTAAKPVYIQTMITIKSKVLTGKFIRAFENQPPASNVSEIGKADKSLC